MTFINQKEEVIQFQLTQYGKYLLSQGELDPVYYAFFDDDILYDGEYGNLTEEPNEAQTRIQQETARPRVQVAFSSMEAPIRAAVKNFLNVDAWGRPQVTEDSKMEKIQPTVEKNYALAEPLGKSKISADFAPSWDAHVLEGEIDGIVNFETGSFSATKIPQINININYEYKNLRLPPTPADDAEEEFYDNSPILYDLEKKDLVMDLSENNVNFSKNNFEIEVFEVVKQTNSDDELLVQLVFDPRELPPEPELILTDKNITRPYYDPTPEYASYYFDIFVDEEISDEVIVSHFAGSKIKNLLSDRIVIQEEDSLEMGNLYEQTQTNYEEECDE